MADWFEALSESHVEFIAAQKMFFIATAPVDGSGFPNLSPKGYDSFAVLSPRELVYVDFPGSGNQSASHIARGGRVTVMFCGFDARALILRIYGRGRVLARDTAAFADVAARLRDGMVTPNVRQLIAIDVEKVQTSCGYAVPRYEFVGDRETLRSYYERAREAGRWDEFIARTSGVQRDL